MYFSDQDTPDFYVLISNVRDPALPIKLHNKECLTVLKEKGQQNRQGTGEEEEGRGV